MKERPEWDSDPDLCSAGAVLYQYLLSYQAWTSITAKIIHIKIISIWSLNENFINQIENVIELSGGWRYTVYPVYQLRPGRERQHEVEFSCLTITCNDTAKTWNPYHSDLLSMVLIAIPPQFYSQQKTQILLMTSLNLNYREGWWNKQSAFFDLFNWYLPSESMGSSASSV